MITTIDIEFLKGSLWKSIKGFMGDDIWLDLEFYQMKEGGYPGTPNTTRRIALDGVPSNREPGWVPLDIVLRGGTHESRNTQKSYPRAFNTTLRIGDVTGDGFSDLLLANHPRIMAVFVGVPEPKNVRPDPPEGSGRRSQRRGIHLAGGPQQGRGTGSPHASHIHVTRRSWSPDATSGNRATSGDDADRPINPSVIFFCL